MTTSEKSLPEVKIKVDGACDPNPGLGGWGAVLSCDTHKKRLWGPQQDIDSFKHQTNNRMELMAAIEALNALKVPCRVRIYSDSAYLINTMNGMYAKRKNVDLWEQLESSVATHSIEWIKASRAQTTEAHGLANRGIAYIQGVMIRERLH